MNGYGSHARDRQQYVDHSVNRHEQGEEDDESPRASEGRDCIRDLFTNSLLLLDDLVRMSQGAYSYDLLRRMELTPEGGKHVHRGVRLSLYQNENVFPVHLDALRFN